MRSIVNKVSEVVMVISMILVLFFGTGLDSEGNTCLLICAVTLVPLALSTITWNLTKEEVR